MVEHSLENRMVLQSHPYELEKPEKKKIGRSKTNYRVLVVDDDDEVREFLQMELGGIYRVMTAKNGNEGLKAGISAIARFDCI